MFEFVLAPMFEFVLVPMFEFVLVPMFEFVLVPMFEFVLVPMFGFVLVLAVMCRGRRFPVPVQRPHALQRGEDQAIHHRSARLENADHPVRLCIVSAPFATETVRAAEVLA